MVSYDKLNQIISDKRKFEEQARSVLLIIIWNVKHRKFKLRKRKIVNNGFLVSESEQVPGNVHI